MGHLQMFFLFAAGNDIPGVSESVLLLQPGVNPDARCNLAPF